MRKSIAALAAATAFTSVAPAQTPIAADMVWHNEGAMPLGPVGAFLYASREQFAGECLTRTALFAVNVLADYRKPDLVLSGYCLHMPSFRAAVGTRAPDLDGDVELPKVMAVADAFRSLKAEGKAGESFEYVCRPQPGPAFDRLLAVARRMYGTSELQMLPVDPADVSAVCQAVDKNVAAAARISGALPS
jgi:hypothetical protein